MTSDAGPSAEERPLRAARAATTEERPPPADPNPTAEEPTVTVTRDGRSPDDEPDPQVLWRWVWRAIRPHIGWVLIGLGALLILFGYLGVSREAIVGKQMPYLISGGIGGVLLSVIGAYFLGTQELRRDSGRLDRLEQQVHELHAALLSRPDAPTIEEPSSNGSGPAPARRVVAVESGETFHRPDCRLAEGKAVSELAPSKARSQGLRPCPVCDPTPAPSA